MDIPIVSSAANHLPLPTNEHREASSRFSSSLPIPPFKTGLVGTVRNDNVMAIDKMRRNAPSVTSHPSVIDNGTDTPNTVDFHKMVQCVGQNTESSVQQEARLLSQPNFFDRDLFSPDVSEISAPSAEDCRENVIHSSAVKGIVNDFLSPGKLQDLTNIPTALLAQSSSVTHLTARSSHELARIAGIYTPGASAMAEHSFESLSRDIALGLHSLNTSFPMNDNIICDNKNQHYYGDFNYYDKSGMIYPEVQGLPQYIQLENVRNLEARPSYQTIGGSKSMDCSANITHNDNMKNLVNTNTHNGLMAQSFTADEQFSPLEPTITSMNMNETSTTHSNTPKKKSRKRARSLSNDSVDMDDHADDAQNQTKSTQSSTSSNQTSQSFRCQMQDCGKYILWRPRHGKNRLLDHVRLHWAKPLKQCQLCNFKALSYRRIHHHHTKTHEGIPFNGTISKETKEDMKELYAWYKECFPDDPLWLNRASNRKRASKL
ncbi:hypothetical protein DICVIV_05514 [Dictyocaulus viviparus]|uniref:C2H2-type domain-containing protein n=1 Tax=Dictyocaulus viviparus TaxID=29172 RepID=A0A0D8XXA7_DICVI|nr:hypothetical protein DICVIV_05514 [Dictyocaulus viviparus]